MDDIAGRVRNAVPGQQIVIYARSGVWWIQPFADQPFTKIRSDSTWKSSIHLGTEYAALLVDPGYSPLPKTATLPRPGNGVVAVAVVKGRPGSPVAENVVRFSGYDWSVRSAGSDHGGEPNAYDAANVSVDQKGFLHLRTAQRDGRWSCAEISLKRSLGYGCYSFTVEDSARFSPSTVLGFFTWDDSRSEGFHNELDIELSSWGDPQAKNAGYSVQPFYAPDHLYRFTAPSGRLTHAFCWEPQAVSFATLQGARQTKKINEHVFRSGVPVPASETVHLDLYDFHHLENPRQAPAEAVIVRFEYHR